MLDVVSICVVPEIVRKCLHILIALLTPTVTRRYVQEALYAAMTDTDDYNALFPSLRDRLQLASREFEDRLSLRSLQERERDALDDDVLSCFVLFSFVLADHF